MVGGKLAASGEPRAIRQKLNDRPFVVRIDASSPRALAAGMLELDAIESVEIDAAGHLRVRSRNVAAAPARAAGRRAAARRPAAARRAARRLARERLRVPGAGMSDGAIFVAHRAPARRQPPDLARARARLAAGARRPALPGRRRDRDAGRVRRRHHADAARLGDPAARDAAARDRGVRERGRRPHARLPRDEADRALAHRRAEAAGVDRRRRRSRSRSSGALAVAVIERGDARRRARDRRRAARGRGGLRGDLHLGGARDAARAR